MPASHSRAWMAVFGLSALFVWGAWKVMVSPLASGDVYPRYSSLRADPLGAKALFDSLAALPELTVTREYKSRATLEVGTTLLMLGISPEEIAGWNPGVLERYEHLLSKGGRLVLAFVPVQTPGSRSQAKGNAPPVEPVIEQRWHLSPRYRKDPEPPGYSSEIPRETALYFEHGPEWHVLKQNENGATFVERELGGGSIVLVADSFPLSNQGLSEGADAELIARAAGASSRIVFDENHLGVSDTGSVAVLVRKYDLEPVLAVLLIAAGLFIWRNSTSFLQPRPAGATNALDGRDSHEGMTALLRRSVPEPKLLGVCLEEWRRTAKSRHSGEIEAEIGNRQGDAVATYRTACRILKGKHD